MPEVTIIGIDLAKRVFQLHWAILPRTSLSRAGKHDGYVSVAPSSFDKSSWEMERT